MEILLRDKRTSGRLTGSVVDALSKAGSFEEANVLARLVGDHAALVDSIQLETLKTAQKMNTQVAGAYDVAPALARIEGSLARP